MITLNSERGLVRVTHWNEIEGLPGFTRDINSKEVKLKQILGSYRLTDFVVCGLTTCHHKHFRGYVVATEHGRVTNIGHDCGRTHFGVDFETMAAAFDRDMLDAERREKLHGFKSRLEDYLVAVKDLKDQPRGANWLNKQMTALRYPDRLPRSVMRVLENMVRIQSPAIRRQRLATRREIELAQAARNQSNERSDDDVYIRQQDRVVEEEVGVLDGMPVLYAENEIRNILILDLEERLKEFHSVDIDTATRHELGRWTKWFGEVDIKLTKCKEIIATGQLFFERENIAKLAELTESAEDEKRVMDFARKY